MNLNRKNLLIVTLIFVTFFITGCTQSNFGDNDLSVTEPETVQKPSQLPQILITQQPTQAASSIPSPETADKEKTPLVVSGTPTPIKENNIFPALIGTPIAVELQTINMDTLDELSLVAIWGKGSIEALAYAPDGKHFVVGSEYGYAIYDTNRIGQSPVWVVFDQPFTYEDLYFSVDGRFLLFEEEGIQKFCSFGDNQWITEENEIDWKELSWISPDGSKEFSFHNEYDPEIIDTEYVYRYMIDPVTKDKLFDLKDETILYSYHERNEPEGCDLFWFSMCGNAYAPSVTHPYRAGFSPTGETLTVEYRLFDFTFYPYSRSFSTLSFYASNNGDLLGTIGSLDDPVVGFDYAPNGKLLIGFMSGVVQIWDLTNSEIVFSNWDFNAPILDINYSNDGEVLFIHRYFDSLELRFSNTGLMIGRFDASAFSVSQVEPLFSWGDAEGMIRLVRIPSMEEIWTKQGHQDRVLDLVFSPDGLELASSGWDCAVKSWNVITGEYAHAYQENWTDAYQMGYEDDNGNYLSSTNSRIFVYNMEFIPETNLLLGYGSWSRVVGWNRFSGATQYMIEPDPEHIYDGMWHLDPSFPQYMVVDLKSNTFFVETEAFEISSGNPSGSLNLPENLQEGCSAFGVEVAGENLQFSLGYQEFTGKICILDAESYQLIHTLDILGDDLNNVLEIEWVYLSPKGNQLLVSISGGVVYVYQVYEAD